MNDLESQFARYSIESIESIDIYHNSKQANKAFDKLHSISKLIESDTSRNQIFANLIQSENSYVRVSAALVVLRIDLIMLFPQAIGIIEDCAENGAGAASGNCLIALDVYNDKIAAFKARNN